ncbi:Crp/Fnr family transcriptional regulator [Stutzerimonas kirkiae]|uniref:Transcriptional regulator n=1 Tax=Stutzerimonas kirkiae TaxID=2211392 RepID=A0A4Q9R478_9GAMM|nr:Crp/Fnr family transcriptional regulator [Stutzerimonas kirkiae]TBU94799.1 transcriptional regulator [Stutzerimonas kirkiae]TBV01873.1 transcriptional regulator [Stutzerimonas kirkiae]TBV07184.1 transcriptional regulator [Stutzerimonas kirkiae]
MPSSHPGHGPCSLPDVLLERFSCEKLARGYLVSAPHSAQDRILYLREGRIRVYVASEDKELTLAYLAPGELFSTHTRAYLRTESACQLLSMPTQRFAQTLANQPGMLALVMPALGRILENSIAIIEDLAFRDVAGRLARFLLVAARQHAQGVAGPLAQLPLELSVGEIARLLATTRQTVSSLLNRMQREGIVQRHGRCLVLLRPDVLQRWQSGDSRADGTNRTGRSVV